MTRASLDGALLFLAALSLAVALLTAWTVRRPHRIELVEIGGTAQIALAIVACALLASAVVGGGQSVTVAAEVAILATIGFRSAFPRLSAVGALRTALAPLLAIVGMPWGLLLLHEAGAPAMLMALAGFGGVAGILLLGVTVAEGLARQALLTHALWRRPIAPLAPFSGARPPKVSIHLPAYAEPPEIVIAALDRLARLDYPAFEVIVCDNNTEDERLWRPVQRHCGMLERRLGPGSFRFFHVAPLPGAKAGALNFCLRHMDPAAELVAVIDADYLAEPDFLSRLVGFFADPDIGYVQTPHDYRDFEAVPYLRACYWEYMPSNKVEMPGIQEYGAAFTIGTMCVIRADALRAAGEWAEWCLTEDSEVSVRLRALGQGGVYLRETMGRGLIPETFDDYKKQRFRWTAGPVQQLRRHWRLFLPQTLGGSREIGGWSKFLEVQRGIAPLVQLAGMLLGLIATIVCAIVVRQTPMEPIVLPSAAWAAMVLGGGAALVDRWQRYRLAGCTRLSDMAMGEVARLSLTYVQMSAGLAGLSQRPLAWRRTPKFKAEGSGLRALVSTIPETAIGIVHLIAAAALIGMAGDLGWHFVVLAGGAALMSACRFFAAPAMALLGERTLRVAVPAERQSPATAA